MINTELCKELYAGSFFMSTKMFMYPLKQKTPSQPVGFSSLLHCQTSWRNPYHSLCILITHCSTPCSLVLYTSVKLFSVDSQLQN